MEAKKQDASGWLCLKSGLSTTLNQTLEEPNTDFTMQHVHSYKAFLHAIYSKFSGMGSKRLHLNVLGFDKFVESSVKTSNDI